MLNKVKAKTFIQKKQEHDLIMIDVVVHGSENQVNKLRDVFGNYDSYTEASNKYKNKTMLVTPIRPDSDDETNLHNIMRIIRNFARDIGGTKTTKMELWTYTDLGDDNIDYDQVIIK